MDYFFRFVKKFGFLGIVGITYYGIGATIRIKSRNALSPICGMFLKPQLKIALHFAALFSIVVATAVQFSDVLGIAFQ